MRRVLVAAMLLTACADGDPAGPAPGEVAFEVVESDTVLSDGDGESGLVLARTSEEGRAAADNVPAEVAAEHFREWDDYGGRGLVGVFAVDRPDPAHTLVIDGVGVERDVLTVTATTQRTGGSAAQVIVTAWTVLSVDAAAVDAVERCALVLDGAPGEPGPCR